MKNLFYLIGVVSILFVGCTAKTSSNTVTKVAEKEACCESAETACCKSTITFKNEDFYKADGSFDVEKGKDAVIAVAKRSCRALDAGHDAARVRLPRAS